MEDGEVTFEKSSGVQRMERRLLRLENREREERAVWRGRQGFTRFRVY